MECNIDAKGKAARLISGLICIVVGLVLAVLAVLGVGSFWLLLGLALGLIAAGAFQVFEARAGWCVMRAMGLKTPM